MEYTGTWPFFESLSFLKIILKPRETDGNIQPEHSMENDSIKSSKFPCTGLINELESSKEEKSFECATLDVNHEFDTQYERSETVIPPVSKLRKISSVSSASSTPSAMTRKKRQKNDDGLEAFLELEREKLKVLHQEQLDNNDDDLLWFKSMLPYMKQLPPLNKLQFRTQMQESLLKELSMLNTQQVGLNTQNTFFSKHYETL